MNRTEVRRCLKKTDIQKLYAIADQRRVPRDRIVAMALASYERSVYDYGQRTYKPADKFELALVDAVRDAVKSQHATNPKRPADAARKVLRISDREQAVFYLKTLMFAFEEVEQYDPVLHHNRPKPPLYIDNQEYLSFVRELLEELKILNKELADRRGKNVARSSDLPKLVNVFLKSYASGLGKGMAILTSAAMGTLLYQLGIGQEVVTTILTRLRPK